MKWFFLVLFMLAASSFVMDAFMRRRKVDAVVLSTSLVKLANLTDAYQVVVRCKVVQTGATAVVAGQLRTIHEGDLALENDELRALQGKQISIYRRPSTLGYASDAAPFRGRSINAWLMGLMTVCVLSAWLYDLWGIQPLFALLRFLHVGGP